MSSQNGSSAYRCSLRGKLVFFAFDLLGLNGEDLRALPLTARRAHLKRLLGRPSKSGIVQLSEILTGGAEKLLKAACAAGLEGIIAKRSDASYESGRSNTWVKAKCGQRQELVVVGYTMPRRSRVGIGALLLGVHEQKGSKDLRYAGAVGSGFSDPVLQALRGALDTMRVDRPPFPKGVAPSLAPKDARWVRPRLLAEVAFTEWTADGLLRHPSFQGMREDKAARDITQEAAMQVAGVTITNSERAVYPKDGLSKGDVARHMERVARLMLPHVAGRPLSFVRCPGGIGDQCFFQKHVAEGVGNAVEQVKIKNKDGALKDYAVVHDAEDLVALVQFGILEIHLWGCRQDEIERPDRIVFDLDPDASVPWETTGEAALLCQKRPAMLGLKSWAKWIGFAMVAVPLGLRLGPRAPARAPRSRCPSPGLL